MKENITDLLMEIIAYNKSMTVGEILDNLIKLSKKPIKSLSDKELGNLLETLREELDEEF